ncbi:hypothetical protein DMN91_009472 [Ooceraea biroi]|uniref:ATP-binding cassette sub-family G member n=1 Tax=Ooceraea biroi TaxID=2015173 RepID=A0A026WFK9_OOCBI|nr:ATP-binding cassette sub-family G member 4 [Ooceraea biroi]EZA54900.1 ATP-binding cassette sub-family G member [Ooceraea biroi]RLU19114.1 hypothetical protein DMN91_009472 [Ooceraea biroi]
MEANDRNEVSTRMLDDCCRIHLAESEKLMGTEKTTPNLRLCIELNEICYSAGRGNSKGTEKTILHNVSGCFEPGKVTVIIGPSGAGKTTLLKIVSGELLFNVRGTITSNGVERNRGTFRKQLCYVSQQFDLLPFLTTKETLYIAARLKLDASQSKQAIYLIVNEIAENFGLSNCLDTLASKLSGGERKRLSIGVEMITKPSVLLLDEPTSGLDSAASNQLISVLHDMAKANCTVICAIHQPSSQMISRFDDIMVLDRGRCMYCGPKSEILNVYSSAGFTCPPFYNIAEFVLEVITEQRDGDLENLYKICCEEYEKFRSHNEYSKPKHDEANSLIASKQDFESDDVLTSNIKQGPSTWQQQRILFLRALICIKRDNTLTKLRLAAHIVVALLLGMVFYDFSDDAEKANSNIACLFFLLLFLFFANSMPAVQMFPMEAAVFLQEHLNNWYSLRSYYSVKILTDLPMQILCCSCFLFISYYLTGQPMAVDRIFQAWSVCVLITILGQTVGILTGAAFNTQIGIFLIPALSIPLLLFAGFFLKLGEIAVYLQPLSTISFFRYAFEGMMQAIYSNRPNLSCPEIYCYLRSPSEILSRMDMPTVSFHVILIILGSWIFCLHIIIYAVLSWKIYYVRK